MGTCSVTCCGLDCPLKMLLQKSTLGVKYLRMVRHWRKAIESKQEVSEVIDVVVILLSGPLW
jgi:hypothetical protein